MEYEYGRSAQRVCRLRFKTRRGWFGTNFIKLDLEDLIYSDESKFSIGYYDGRKTYRRRIYSNPNDPEILNKNERQFLLLWDL